MQNLYSDFIDMQYILKDFEDFKNVLFFSTFIE